MLLLLSVLSVSFVLCSTLCICVLVLTTELTLVRYSHKLNAYSIITIIIIIIITGNKKAFNCVYLTTLPVTEIIYRG